MPSERLEKGSFLTLKSFTKMDTAEIPQNNSQAELVHNLEDGSATGGAPAPDPHSFRSVKFHEWTVVLVLCFVNLINYMDRFTLAGILSDLQASFDIKDNLGGLLQTAFVLSYMIFAPLFGYLGDRYSRRWIMAGGVGLWSLTTLAGSFMTHYWWFLLFRALVGIGEASYSTIAPTIISDLFVGDLRSKMLAMFYFAIPVGSGLGYIVGSETAKLAGQWNWALRVTPILGVIAVLLIIFVVKDPVRGQSEGSSHMEATAWTEDIVDIVKNKSFMFSTAGFTCVAFVAGALSWWGPKFIEMGIKLQSDGTTDTGSTSFIFGAITMVAGIVGLSLGCFLSNIMKARYPKIDPLICAIGLIISSPLLLGTTYASTQNTIGCYILLFLGQVSLNLNWAIVSDMTMYVVLPMRRSTAQGLQLLASHALGDAGSPYLIGVLSDALNIAFGTTSADTRDNDWKKFHALQYALFSTCFVEILGGLFFLVTALFVLNDKHKVDKAVQGNSHLLVNSLLETEPIIS